MIMTHRVHTLELQYTSRDGGKGLFVPNPERGDQKTPKQSSSKPKIPSMHGSTQQ